MQIKKTLLQIRKKLLQIKKAAANKKVAATKKVAANKKSCYTCCLLLYSAGAMFCSRCGKEASQESKYCSACGLSLQQSSVTGPPGIDSESKQPAVKRPINFQEFLKRKSESRKEHFKFRPKSAKKEKVDKDVSINIGIMRYINGTLKFCRGRNLPVTFVA